MFIVTFTKLVFIGVLICSGFHNSNADDPLAAAKIARRLVHEANWTSTSTISSHPDLVGYPMGNTIAIDDSNPEHKGTGRIYFVLTDHDYTGQDVKNNKHVTMLVSDAMNLKCGTEDPMGHKCPRAYLSGEVQLVTPKTHEFNVSIEAFCQRHPDFRGLFPPGQDPHDFYLVKLNLKRVVVFAGTELLTNVPLQDYYGVNPQN